MSDLNDSQNLFKTQEFLKMFFLLLQCLEFVAKKPGPLKQGRGFCRSGGTAKGIWIRNGRRTGKGWSLATPDTGRVYTSFAALCVQRVAIYLYIYTCTSKGVCTREGSVPFRKKRGKVKRYKSKYGCQHPNSTRKVTR